MAPSIPPYSSVYSFESSSPHGQVKSLACSQLLTYKYAHPLSPHLAPHTSQSLIQLPRPAITRESMVTLGKSSKISRGMVSLRRRRPFQLMVLRRLRELKKIVPVGARRKAKVDVLLRQTAEYICMLELKVAVLRRLSAIYGV
jgi:hypothetical protein